MEHNPNHLFDYINKKNNLKDDNNTITNTNILKEKRCDIMKDKLKICLDNNHSKNSNYCFNLMTSIVENCDN